MDTALAPAALTSLAVCRLGVVPYATAWRLQKAILWERIEDRRPDTLLLLQHPPVFTLGRNSMKGTSWPRARSWRGAAPPSRASSVAAR